MLLALKRCCFILYKNLAFFPPLTATLRRFTLVPFFSQFLLLAPPPNSSANPTLGMTCRQLPPFQILPLPSTIPPTIVLPLPLSLLHFFSNSYCYPQPLTSHLQPTSGVPCQWLNQSFPHILRFSLHFFYFYLLY